MELRGRFTVDLPGETHTFEPDEITNNEWRQLQADLDGLSFDEWLTGIDRRDPKPCDVLVWFLRHKAGNTEELLAIDYPIRRLDVTRLGDDTDPEAPAGSDPATSERPATTTESGPGTSTD